MREMMASSESEHRPDPRTRVAVVGTGLAGLTTAYLLRSDQKRRYAVTLFEQADSLAFDSASVTIKNETTDVVERLDLPMRASAGGYYSNLLRLYHHLRVPLHPIRFLFVFAKALSTTTDGTARPRTSQDAANETYFVHASNLHQTPPPWPGNRGFIPHIIEILYLIVCQFWFTLACFLVSPLDEHTSATGSCESLAEYLERIRLPRRYASHYVVPLMSSVSTCSHEEMLAFPASDVVNYKKLSHGQQHYTICGGVSQVESRLAVGLEDVRVNSRVMEIVPNLDGSEVTVRWQSTVDGSGHINEQVFDRVVLAVSPDVAGKIFRPLRSMVGRLPTRRVESSVLRPEEMEGQSVVRVADSSDAETAACAHHLANAPPSQVITLRTLFPATGNVRTEALHTMPSGVVVSTCPLEEDVDSKAILKKAKFTRTLRSTEGRAVVQQLMGESKSHKKAQDDMVTTWVNGQDHVWLVGAWCWDGMVLLEGCIVSAMRVASDFGVRIPWE